MTTSKLALSSFLLSLSGLIMSAILFALIYFRCLPNISYLWVVVAICLTQLPALAMSITCRSLPLGRAAMALSSSLLVGVIAGTLIFAPLSSSTNADKPSLERVGQLPHQDSAESAYRSPQQPAPLLSKQVLFTQQGANRYA